MRNDECEYLIMRNDECEYKGGVFTVYNPKLAEILASLYLKPATYESLIQVLDHLYGQITMGLDDDFYCTEYGSADEFYTLAIADLKKAIAHMSIADNMRHGIK